MAIIMLLYLERVSVYIIVAGYGRLEGERVSKIEGESKKKSERERERSCLSLFENHQMYITY